MPVIVCKAEPTFPDMVKFKFFWYAPDGMTPELICATNDGNVGLLVRSAYDPLVATVARLGLPDKSAYAPLVATADNDGVPDKSAYAPLNNAGLLVRSAYDPLVATADNDGVPVI